MSKKNKIEMIEKDVNHMRNIANDLHSKIDSGLVPTEELRTVKAFINIIIVLLIIFEMISLCLIMVQR